MGLTTVDVDVLAATGKYEREPAGNRVARTRPKALTALGCGAGDGCEF